MNIITINDPVDVFFPLEKDAFIDPNVIYHGTGSCFISKIEKKGWKLNDLPYYAEDFVKVEQIYDDIGFTGFSNRGWTSFPFVQRNGEITRNLNPSFTSNYWTARNYSANSVGEAIRNLVIAIDDYILLSTNREKQEYFKNKLIKTSPHDFYSKFFDHDETYLKNILDYMIKNKIPNESECDEFFNEKKKRKLSEILIKLNDPRYLESNLSIILDIKKKYSQFLDSYPVVYVVKTNKIDEISSEDKEYELDIEMKSNIEPQEIMARIDFPNGVKRFMPNMLATPYCKWNQDKLNEQIKNIRDVLFEWQQNAENANQFMKRYFPK